MEKRELERLLWDGWLDDNDYVFASYSSQDWEKVFTCVLELRTRGINVLIDTEFQENSSSSWLRNLEEQIIRNPRCRGMIAFVSGSYLSSYACLTELIANRTRKQIRNKGHPLPVFYIALETELETPQQIDSYIYRDSIQEKLRSQPVQIEPAEYTKMENFLMDCHLSNYPDRQAVRELLDDIRNRFDVSSLMNELIFSDKTIMPSIQPFVDAVECAELLKRNFVNNKNGSIQMPVLDGLRRKTLERLSGSTAGAKPGSPVEDSAQHRHTQEADGSTMTPAGPRGEGDIEEAGQAQAEALSPQAQQDDADEQYNWGLRYEFGTGVKKSPVMAVLCYRKAANQGHASAQYNLGLCYYNGTGVDKDPVQAARWFRMAAEQGHTNAQHNLALCCYNLGLSYYNGSGVKKDPVQAAQWYCIASEQGYADAQYNLGLCYYNGTGVGKDPVQAAQWFRKAAEQGHASAQCNLGLCYYSGTGVEKDPVQAVQWFRKVAERGHASAQCNLGLCYYSGMGVKKDLVQAVLWFRKAAEQGHASAQYNLGLCYYNGTGVRKSLGQAIQWFRKAAEQGHAGAQKTLDKLGK